jgi:hypothetical protein
LNLGIKGVFAFFFISAWVFLWAIKQLENFENMLMNQKDKRQQKEEAYQAVA